MAGYAGVERSATPSVVVAIEGIDDIKDLMALVPKDLERAHGAAARSAAAAGYNEADKLMAEAAGRRRGTFKRYQRVFSSVDVGTREARAWLGLNPFPVQGEDGKVVYHEFPEDFDPGPRVGEVMAGAYLRVLDSQVQKIIDGA